MKKTNTFNEFNLILVFLLALVLFGCQNRKERRINQMEVSFELIRFDQQFVDTDHIALDSLKQEFPYLFHPSVSDSVWKAKRTDSWFIELQHQVDLQFDDVHDIEKDLRRLFQHLKYYFPNIQTPSKLISLTSDIDYETKIVYLDSIVLIALDSFLGYENEFYQGIHDYIRRFLSKEYLIPSVAKEIAKKIVGPSQSRNFISKMIHHGKILYIMELLLPKTPLKVLLEYTEANYQWAEEYERQSWYYFIENELLYSSDTDLSHRFLEDAPYSKFYLAIDSDSSPRIGEYIGYQIIQSYKRNNPSISVSEIIEINEEELFKLSGYKPPR